jgi:hypothetical protein
VKPYGSGACKLGYSFTSCSLLAQRRTCESFILHDLGHRGLLAQQEIPESVKATVEAINKELRLTPQLAEAS